MELQDLRGLGPARLAELRAMGIHSLRDLLLFLPVDYEDLTAPGTIAACQIGPAFLEGTIRGKPVYQRFGGLVRVTASLQDATGTIPVVWFNQPWMSTQMKDGMHVMLYGRVAERNGKLNFQNPRPVDTPGVMPVYKPVGDIPPKTLSGLIASALPSVEELFPEILPEKIVREHELLSYAQAVRLSHQPGSLDDLRDARRRTAFQSMLLYQAAVGLLHEKKEQGFPMPLKDTDALQFWDHLGFAPTKAQARVLSEIMQDMRKTVPMARMVQGDVGCGKTALALGAMYLSHTSGFQSALMAPTDILARQHYESAKPVLEGLGMTCGLLTGTLRASEKKKAHQAVKDGSWDAVFGTHALISEGVEYAHLGLVITDEQHRFGVRQRSSLQEKGDRMGRSPHVLVMSATPIPRSLALILYGDLDVSIVDELPPGRTPVKTRLVPPQKRKDMYTYLRGEVEKGAQAYVVCPLVEDSEALGDVRSAKATYEELLKGPLKGLRVGLTWGEQPPMEKAEVLEKFSSGNLDVLVSTTVIEVGVNVPNSTIMIVENAERFGLSQLHQLRGRVGRGTKESWCFLLAGNSKKLSIMAQTNDGFEISKRDLEIRGPGELMGTRQSGQKVSDILLDGDIRLLEEAVSCMKELRETPELQEDLRQVEKTAMELYGDRVQQAAVN
ncbi:MAG: ATP-dependent DNA helicase RecG [Clostridia bacterium]|nr:ATP-dependent DNA helicase RecG [Clostridia bacterium]